MKHYTKEITVKKKYPVIGLTGVVGSGKDSVAEIFSEQYRFIRLGFADPIYEMASIVTRTPAHVLQKREGKEVVLDRVNASPRKLMQTLGTEWGRQMIDENLWVNHLDSRLRSIEIRTGLNGLVISDVRFQNEVDFVHRLGGEVWRVGRPNNPFAIGDKHASEKSEFEVDDVIVNNGTLHDLKAAVMGKMVEFFGV